MIFLGLGNINNTYSRHNIGHLFLNQLSENYNCKWIDEYNYQFTYCNKNILIKTKDYFTSNNIIQELLNNFDFFKHQLIIIHDDIFLPVGKIRLRKSKGKSSYKSIQLLYQNYNNFLELKIGIDLPQSQNRLLYINEDFSLYEFQFIMKSINVLVHNIDIFNIKSLSQIQTLINTSFLYINSIYHYKNYFLLI